MITLRSLLYIIITLSLFSCKKSQPALLQLDRPTESVEQSGISWDDILTSGEFIVGTISGPDTYFDYNGEPSGRQYKLLCNFAQQKGLRLRVETAHSESELCDLLQSDRIDLVMYSLNLDTISNRELLEAGLTTDSCSWAVRPSNNDLKGQLDMWFQALSQETIDNVAKSSRAIIHPTIVRKVRSPYLSREKGIISIYDNLFKKAAQTTGWDWRLIASQCYQESGFDPNAVSSAGARGLMQIMPQTAASLGLAKVEDPNENVAAAARYIVQLNQKFSDIRDTQERIRFVLAAYNGGPGHIKDAQALARKFGRNPQIWANVEPFIIGLQGPRYYLDPVVKNGYMIGSQTANYVASIMLRWQQYGGHVSAGKSAESYTPPTSSAKPNKYRKETHILKPLEQPVSERDNN